MRWNQNRTHGLLFILLCFPSIYLRAEESSPQEKVRQAYEEAHSAYLKTQTGSEENPLELPYWDRASKKLWMSKSEGVPEQLEMMRQTDALSWSSLAVGLGAWNAIAWDTSLNAGGNGDLVNDPYQALRAVIFAGTIIMPGLAIPRLRAIYEELLVKHEVEAHRQEVNSRISVYSKKLAALDQALSEWQRTKQSSETRTQLVDWENANGEYFIHSRLPEADSLGKSTCPKAAKKLGRFQLTTRGLMLTTAVTAAVVYPASYSKLWKDFFIPLPKTLSKEHRK